MSEDDEDRGKLHLTNCDVEGDGRVAIWLKAAAGLCSALNISVTICPADGRVLIRADDKGPPFSNSDLRREVGTSLRVVR